MFVAARLAALLPPLPLRVRGAVTMTLSMAPVMVGAAFDARVISRRFR